MKSVILLFLLAIFATASDPCTNAVKSVIITCGLINDSWNDKCLDVATNDWGKQMCYTQYNNFKKVIDAHLLHK